MTNTDTADLDDVVVPAGIAAEAGFIVPVEISGPAWADCVQWTPQDTARTGAIQDQDGRLWDLLWMASRAYLAAERRRQTGAAVFTVHRVPRNIRLHPDDAPPPVYLVVQLGEYDNGDPVVTVSLHEESWHVAS